MPTVASHPIRQPLPALTPPRSANASHDQDGASPFAMLLDSARPPAEAPASPPPRKERVEQKRSGTDRSDQAAPADDKPADTAAPSNEASDAAGTKTDDSDTETKAEPDETVAPVVEAALPGAALVTIAEAAPQPAPPASASPVAVQPAAPQPAVPLVAPAVPEAAPDVEQLAAIATAGAESGKIADAPANALPKSQAMPAEAKPVGQTAAAPEVETATPATPVDADSGDSTDSGGEHAARHRAPATEEALNLVGEKRVADAAPPRIADAFGAVKAGAEAMQNLGLQTLNHTAAAATAASSPSATAATVAPAAAAVPMAGLAVEIASQAQIGRHRFEIRLDPPELGRIDVRLDVDRDGNVTSRLVVDRVETLDLLRRDAQQLERALQQAGLKTADNALQFSLRDQNSGRDDDTSAQTPARLFRPDDEPAPPEAVRRYGVLGLGGGLDIRV